MRLNATPFRLKELVLALTLIFFLGSCKKNSQPVPENPSTNYELGFVEAPASVYSAIANAPAPPASGMLPSSFFLDIPSRPFDQGSQGSCVSCATAMAKSILDHVKNNTAYPNDGIIYSPAYLFNQVHLDPSNCKVGSYVYSNLEVLKQQGICKLSEMVYNPSNCTSGPSASQLTLAAAHKIDHYFKIDPINISWIKEFIYAGHAVVVAFKVDDYFMQATSNSIWKQFGLISRGEHAALLYGWDDSKSAFKMLNSWGSSWGNGGTVWVDYNFVQNGASILYGRIFEEAYIVQNPGSVTGNVPVADFEASGTSIVAGQQISFRDLSSNSPTSWSWTFSGGSPNTSTSQNPAVVYNTPGTYSVTLQATNNYGTNTKTKTAYINVSSASTWSCGQPFTDTRDGNTYATISINGQCWMTENLKYTNGGTVGKNYNNSTSNYNTYGRLYSFNEVKNSDIAPSGWHIPSYSEVMALNDYIFSTYSNYGGALKSTSNLWNPPNTGATNSTGFSALPSGIRDANGNFTDLGQVFYMWTSTPQGSSGGEASYLRYNGTGFGGGFFSSPQYMSVRCIRN